jgi:hypothetical protein
VQNESAELFDAPKRPQALLGDDLIAVLAGRLERLIERHRATQRAVNELSDALAARDRRIVELDAKLASSERARGELVGRIDALIAEVDALLEGAGVAAEADET